MLGGAGGQTQQPLGARRKRGLRTDKTNVACPRPKSVRNVTGRPSFGGRHLGSLRGAIPNQEVFTMRTITGLFDTYDEASSAVRSLKDAGISGDDISIVANNSDGSHGRHDGADNVAQDAGAGAGIGAAVGGAGGLLTGLGLLAIPGVGPVVAGGWLLATAVGAVAGAAVGGATGGIVGAMTEAGVDEQDAHVYAEGVRRGSDCA